MRLNGHPWSFLDAYLYRVSKPCDDKPCYEEASAILLDIVPRYGIDDTIQRVTFVYFLCQSLGSAVFIKFKGDSNPNSMYV